MFLNEFAVAGRVRKIAGDSEILAVPFGKTDVLC